MNTNKILEIPYPVGTILSTKVDGKWQDDKIDHYIVTENGLGVVLILNYDKQPRLSNSIPLGLIMKKWVPANVDINEALSDLNSALKDGIEALENYDKNKKNDKVTEEQLIKEGNEIGGYYDNLRDEFNGMRYELTDEMKKDRLNCGEDADCNECSCQIGTDDCIYNHVTIVADYIKKMNNNQLAIYLHSWQTENMSVEEIKDLLNSEHTLEDVSMEQSKKEKM